MTLNIDYPWQPDDDPREYVECRTLGHAWDKMPNVSGDRSLIENTVLITLRCTRCHTVRRDVVSVNSGDVEGRSYNYAERYRHDGQGTVRRSTWRLAYLRATRVLKEKR